MIECVNYPVFPTLSSLVSSLLWVCLLFDSCFRAMEVLGQ